MRTIWAFMLCVLAATPPHAGAGGLESAMAQSAAGLKAQSARINVASQNVANAESVALTPAGEPYRRKRIFFGEKYDPKTDATLVVVKKIDRDYVSPLEPRFDPSHPAANTEGYVLYPNVDSEIESADIREAERSYEANMTALEASRTMYTRTIDLLR